MTQKSHEEKLPVEKLTKLSHDWEELPPVPPDGGWGWVVVAGAMLTHILVDGITMCFGVFLIDLQEEFQEGIGKTAWVGSLIPGMYMTTGPLVSALCNKFSCQVVVIVGSISAAIFFFLSSFSQNLNTLIFLYGVMGGISFGLMYLPSIIIVGFYFEKRRALATGLAVCGSGIGTIIFAPLFQFFLDQYGWQGTFWMISGLVLNGAVCGSLFRPLQPRRIGTVKSFKTISQDSIQLSISEGSVSSDEFCDVPGEPHEENPKIGRVRSEAAILYAPPPITERRTRTVSEGYSYERNRGDSRKEITSQLNLPLALFVSRAASPFYREDIFFCGSLNSIPDLSHPSVTQGPSSHASSQVANAPYNPTLPSIPEDTTFEHPEPPKESWMTPFLDVLRNIFNFSIFKEVSFVFLCSGSTLAGIGVLTPFIYVAAMAEETLLIPARRATWLLSVMGISTTIGRVISGWMNDRPWADSIFIYALSPIACGVSTSLVPLMDSYSLLVVYSIIFGMSLSFLVTLRTIVLTQLYGIQRLSNTFGLLLLFQGLAAFVGPPLSGLIYDITKSYNASFLTSGVLMTLGGLIMLPCRRIAAWQHKRQMKKLPHRTRNISISENIT